MRSRRTAISVLLLGGALAVAAACGGPQISDINGGGGDRSPTPTGTPINGHHHPPGWADVTAHGPAAKLVAEDCRTCHGATLTGGTWNNGTSNVATPDCDSCHASGWRTNCTFCHGGTDNTSGAPPRDITGETATANLVFKKHTQHVTAGPDHVAFDCVQCHSKPTDALTTNHWFDSTPGWAEVNFAGGLAVGGTYAGQATGKCMNNYCHGNGQTPGTYDQSQATPGCSTCHGYLGNGGSIATMSGRHSYHINRGYTCVECHGATVGSNNKILADPSKHVNGVADNMFTTSNVTFNAGTQRCNGTCHGKSHSNLSW